MATLTYFDTVQRTEISSGKTIVVPSATVFVYLPGTTTTATLFEDDGTTPLSNPLTTDANGMYQFRTEEGKYDLRIVFTAFDQTFHNIAVGASINVELNALAPSTGWLSNGEITINADPTKFDVAAGTGVIVDSTDPTNIIATSIAWTAKIAVVPTFIATAGTTFLFINSSGNLVQDIAFPISPDIRDKIQIGAIVHGDNVNISETSDFLSAPIYNVAASQTDLIIALGVLNISGNDYEGDPAGNLKFKKDDGMMFYFGIDMKSDPTDPNNIDTPETVAPDVLFTWRDGSGGFNTAATDTITAGVCDKNSGGSSAPTDTLSTNNWTNHRIFYSPDANTTVIQYGQNSYNSDTAAIAGQATESFVQNPSFSGVPFRSVCSMRGGASDLTSTGDAVFNNLNRFGLI